MSLKTICKPTRNVARVMLRRSDGLGRLYHARRRRQRRKDQTCRLVRDILPLSHWGRGEWQPTCEAIRKSLRACQSPRMQRIKYLLTLLGALC